MTPFETLMTLEDPVYDDVEYIVLKSGETLMWYRVDHKNEHQAAWEHIPAPL